MTKVRIWDLPTRIFHWALVFTLIALVVTGEVGGSAMDWHYYFGYSVVALLVFRIVWGFAGGRWSRFSVFVRSPANVLRYVRDLRDLGSNPAADRHVGHNPLGALSVLALLATTTLQAVSGLFSDDDILARGPLAHLTASEWVSRATWLHTGPAKWGLLLLVGLHMAAIFYYVRIKKHDLLRPMLDGDQILDRPTVPSADRWPHRLGALVLFSLFLSTLWWGLETLRHTV